MNRDILFIVMDTARKDFAEDNNIMPNFQKLRSNSIEFTQAIANGPWTLPSHASMFTGTRTASHQTHAGTKSLTDDYPTIAEILQKNGYETAAISNNGWISPEFGFNRGFGTFIKNWKLVQGGESLVEVAQKNTLSDQIRTLLPKVLNSSFTKTILNSFYMKFINGVYDDGAFLTNKRAKKWWKESGSSNNARFLFINYLEPHLPYTPPKNHVSDYLPEGNTIKEANSVNQNPWEYICGNEDLSTKDFELLRGLYSGELNYLDRRLGNLIKFLKSDGSYEDTNIILVGDHGENIGDHGLMDHQYCLYDTLINTPLLIKPAYSNCSNRVQSPVELRDIFPTIMNIAGLSSPTNSDISSKNLIRYQTREYCISEYAIPQPSMEALEEKTKGLPDDINNINRSLQAIRTADYKYIRGSDGSQQLLDVSTDESKCDIEKEEEIVTRLSSRLDNELIGFNYQREIPEEMDHSTKERLENLGYLQ